MLTHSGSSYPFIASHCEGEDTETISEWSLETLRKHPEKIPETNKESNSRDSIDIEYIHWE